MIKRDLTSKIINAAKQFPIVSVMGPRQSGKTTLVKQAFPKAAYVSFEDPDVRRSVELDPRGFLTSFKQTLIIDEVQRIPEVFSYIQAVVDERGKNGQFIFAGSQNYLLQEKITQSLAGRVAIIRLLPLSYTELKAANKPVKNLEAVMHKGFYPALWKQRVNIQLLYSSYVNTYLERDVRQIENISNLSLFQTFLRLCAGRAGQVLNLSTLGNECGISHTTAKTWLGILESSFIIHLLQPYYENFNKRLVKSPKLYFYDTGLLCYLLDIREAKQLNTHYLKGAIFENLVFAEIIKQSSNQLRQLPIYFWRDKTLHEIDFVIKQSAQKTLVEVKTGKTVRQDFFEGISYFEKYYTGKDKLKSYLVYTGNIEYKHNKTQVLSFDNILKVI